MKNHPLRVYNPGSGIRYLLQWWTHNEQNHVIVAESEKALYPVFKHVCDRYSDARVNKVLEVELVAPSNQMCQKALEARKANEINSFCNEVMHRIKELMEGGYPLPPQFKRCGNWIPDYLEEGEEIPIPDSYCTEWHPNCRNCNTGFILVGHTPESLYDNYSEAWRSIHPIKTHEDKKLVCSLARQANDGEDIWIASASFGHHSPGVGLVQLNSIDFVYEDALFYFCLRREIDKSPWEKMIVEANKARKEKAKASSEKYAQIRQKEIAISISKTLSVFG